MYLEKAKRIVIWDGGSKSQEFNTPALGQAPLIQENKYQREKGPALKSQYTTEFQGKKAATCTYPRR
jgi:hypothetical protein